MGHTCRGTINLATANIAVEDSCNFVISNGGAQTYHLKASSEVERQRWITALELAKAKAVRNQAESGEGGKNEAGEEGICLCRTVFNGYRERVREGGCLSGVYTACVPLRERERTCFNSQELQFTV